MSNKFILNKSKKELRERLLVKTLLCETLEMCHLTKEIKAIKRLIQVHDILEMNESILEKFSMSDGPVWDLCSLSDLEMIGRELIIYHQQDFTPLLRLKNYRLELGALVYIAKNNLENFAN